MAPDVALDILSQAASMTPVPFLQPSLQILKFILLQFEQIKTNKRQLKATFMIAAQILVYLNNQLLAEGNSTSKLEDEPWMKQSRGDFERVLVDIADLSTRLVKTKFIKAFLDATSMQDKIQLLNDRLFMTCDAFQISAQIGLQTFAKRVELARQEDQAELDATLKQLLDKQETLIRLVGKPDATPAAHGGGDDDQDGDSAEMHPTLFGFLGDIQRSLKSAQSADREALLEEVLLELRKKPSRPPIELNPVIAHLKPGIKPDVLIVPLASRMKYFTWHYGISCRLTPQQCYEFENLQDSSKRFVEYLASCYDRALQYAAVEVFQNDKHIKHFFENKIIYASSKDPNPILAYLKPGLHPSILVAPLQYHIDEYNLRGLIAQHLSRQQIGSFFCSGEEGCQRFVDHLVDTDDRALQYATLDEFRKDKRVAFYFISDAAERE